MGQIDNTTLENIHELIDRFFDAQTSPDEEKILRQILVNIPYSSPKIDEARAYFSLFAMNKKASSRKKRLALRRIISIAATITVIAVIGIAYFIPSKPNQEYFSCIAGNISDDENTALNIFYEQINDAAEANSIMEQTIFESINDFSDAINSQP